jgi:hypothetical protein
MESAFKQICVLYIILCFVYGFPDTATPFADFFVSTPPSPPQPPPLVLPETRVNDRLPPPVWQSGENNIFGTIRNRWKTIGTIQSPTIVSHRSLVSGIWPILLLQMVLFTFLRLFCTFCKIWLYRFLFLIKLSISSRICTCSRMYYISRKKPDQKWTDLCIILCNAC